MYLNVHLAEGVCPRCTQAVDEAVVTTMSQLFCAQVQALHRSVGHTVVLLGLNWYIRCAEEKVASKLIGARVTPSKVLVWPKASEPAPVQAASKGRRR